VSHTARIFTALLCLWPALVAGAGNESLRVYASIEPVRFLVERVGGAQVTVGVVVEAGRRPETYEPTPRQSAAMAQADVFFGVSMPLEAAWRRQLPGVKDSGPEWVDLAGALPGREEAAAHGELDPHIWLSPVNAWHMVSVIADVLAREDPHNEAEFRANAAALGAELESLHRDISRVLAKSDVDAFLVYHPAWGHFARAYGLTQIAIEAHGKEPGPRSLVAVIEKAREAGIRTVFVDPRHSRRLAETVAQAIDGSVQVLDPLAPDYLDNLRRAARAIAGSGS